ncbi:MAG: L-threonylcarbamoyladenylate synthase [Actinomycetota bacterium]|nr:L-threonylcarbamoyladenylate synthase [Actinomycetota bacterium]
MPARHPSGGPRVSTDPERAAAALIAGSLVALPTETVYGLAAVASDRTAVARVFEVKRRPADHPLIVHVDSLASARQWVLAFPEPAAALARRYWPGPLTLVLPRAPWVPDEVTGGQPTVALRVPDHPLTARVLELVGEGLAGPCGVVAPSANAFGRVSPTSAADVMASLGGRLGPADLILDGGDCRVGLESTIVDASGGELRVLRPGAVLVDSATGQPGDGEVAVLPRVPGSHSAHYAPAAEVVIASGEELLAASASPIPEDLGTGLLAPVGIETPVGWIRLASPTDDVEFAAVLYRGLRAADDAGLHRIVVVPPTTGGLLPAILDRLRRAAR